VEKAENRPNLIVLTTAWLHC